MLGWPDPNTGIDQSALAWHACYFIGYLLTTHDNKTIQDGRLFAQDS